jgi:glutathione synthase/RimK-type ligase-like ATP-grasp enzyme
MLAVGSAADDTFLWGLRALLRHSVRFDAIDIVDLIVNGGVNVDLDDPLKSRLTLAGCDYMLSEYSGAWVRILDVTSAAPTPDLSRRAEQMQSALAVLLGVLPQPVVNPPRREKSNFSKLFHATELGRLTGFQIPRSLLTNDADEAVAFANSCPNGAIFKGSSGSKTWVTLFDERKHAQRLPLIASCPVLLQERIVGPDVRIHVVDQECFAEAIDSVALDYRRVHGNSYRSQTLPASVDSGCGALTSAIGVPFLGVDFKIDRSLGDWYFLEANSFPCFQGYDRRAHGAISGSIVRFLQSDRPRPEASDRPSHK